jgi:hypothetical protein
MKLAKTVFIFQMVQWRVKTSVSVGVEQEHD